MGNTKLPFFRDKVRYLNQSGEWLNQRILNLCLRIVARLDANPKSPLYDLSPTDRAEKVQPYMNQLSELIEKRSRSVFEIAITGPYSSGKTSLLKTFARLNPQHTYTWISLATFKAPKNGHGQSMDAVKVNTLEKSIVQQLLYRSKSDAVSSSRFRRIYTSPIKLWFSAVVLCWLVTIAFLYSKQSLMWETFLVPIYEAEFWMMVFVSAVALLLVQDGLRAIRRFDVSKFSFYNVEVAFGGDNDSVFNEYLEEILYHFKANKTDVVIFEDLDRFPGNDIFIRLKELNTIINHSADIDRSVRFVYAVQDDIFNNSERVKFFDAIIPVIPVANESNAYPIFKELLEQADLSGEIDDSMLRVVMIYIDDMRILKNIVNEFVLYHAVLSQYMDIDRRVKNQLMCFMIYKNCYCDDFAKLHKSEGMLVDIFDAAARVRLELSQDLGDKIKLLTNQVMDADKEELQSIEELNAAFQVRIFRQYSEQKLNAITNVHNMSTLESVKPSNFKKLLAVDNINIVTSNGNRGGHKNLFRPLAQEGCEYQLRLRAIENKQKANRDELRSQIQNLHEQLALCKTLPIEKLCRWHPESWGDCVLSIFQGKETKLLRALVENDFLDEHYHKFIAIFKPGHISARDHKFILSVNNNEPLEPEYPLDDVGAVLDYVGNSRLHNRALLNYALIDYLLQKGETIPLKTMLKSNRMDLSVTHIFWDSVSAIRNADGWVNLLVKTVRDYWRLLIESELTDSNKYSLLTKSLLQIKSEEVDAVLSKSDKSILKSYLDKETQFLNALPTVEVERDQIYRLFGCLNVRIVALEDVVQVERLNEIFGLGLYVFSPENLLTVFNSRNQDNCVLPLEYERLIDDLEIGEVIEDNRQQVSDWVIDGLMCISSAEVWIEYLNHPALDQSKKQELAGLDGCVVDFIKNIDSKDLWGVIVNGRKMVCNWENVISCLVAEGEGQLDAGVLSGYLNDQSVVDELVSKEHDFIDDEGVESFRRYILGDRIRVGAFKKYESHLGLHTLKEEIPSISVEKLEYLISADGFEALDVDLFSALLDKDARLGVVLLEAHPDAYLTNEIIPKLKLNASLLSLVGNSKVLDEVAKKSLYELSGCASELIIKTNSLPNMFVPRQPYKDNGAIPRLSVSEIGRLVSSGVSEEIKILVLIGQMQYLPRDQVLTFLGQIDGDYSVLQNEGSSIKRDYSEMVRKLAVALKENENIKDFKVSGDGLITIKKREITFLS